MSNSRNSRALSKRQGVRLIVAARQKWTCFYCKNLLNETFEIDHVQSLCQKGNDILQNLQALCRNCHGKKTIVERQIFIDQQREERTGVSKYFDPESFSFLG